jgi:hypothetical protein
MDMTWFPHGPDTVVWPRRSSYTRLSRRNEWGGQCLVEGIAVRAADQLDIAVIVRRVGGSSAFRTRDGGSSWTPIADDITRADAQADLTAVALHPARPDVVYLGGGSSRRFYALRDGSPPASVTLPGDVTRIVVDRASAGLDDATIYVATSAGISYSTTGGATFTHVTLGRVDSLAVYQPLSGERRFYAGVRGRGLVTATDVAGPWTDHFGVAGSGLPAAVSNATYATAVYLDISPRQPDRVYLAVFEAAVPPSSGTGSQRMFVSTSAFPHPTWEERGSGGEPSPDSFLDGVDLLVAPENLGPDTADVLLFTGPIFPQRSLDGGRNWELGSQDHILHTDHRALAYWPPPTAYYPDTLTSGMTVPRATVLVGNDGGIAASVGYTDPAFAFPAAEPGSSTAFDEGAALAASSGIPRSLNHGLQALAIHRYASNTAPLAGGAASTIGYASTLDTGFSRHLGTRAWTAVMGGEGGPLIARPVANGVRLWTTESGGDSWPGWPMYTSLDTDGAGPASSANVTMPDGSTLRPTSRFQPLPGGTVAVGAVNQAAGGTTRTAFVARVDATGAATRISQSVTPDQRHRFYLLAAAGDSLLAASIDQRLWRLDGASAAGPASVWTEITGLPAGLASPVSRDWIGTYWASGPEVRGPTPMIAAIAAAPSGAFYVLMTDALDVPGAGGATTHTALLRVDAGGLHAESCVPPAAAAIPAGASVGELVAHPVTPATLFAARNGRVFRLAAGAPDWTWTDLSENLPGPELHDLWIGNVAPSGSPRIVLRAATSVRGVWEREVDPPPEPPPPAYMRDHALDPGWLHPSAEGVANPLRVTERAWHWQSPDIKVDTPELTPTSVRYYQNDPEAPAPTAEDFAWMKDDSTGAAAGETARVWVQVHSRAFPTTPLTPSVWAITCLYAGMLPTLPPRGAASFWTRFQPTGAIDTGSLGPNWTSLGVMPLAPLDATHSRVAGFTFSTGAEGDHRCIAAFVHGPGALLVSGPGFTESLDDCVRLTPQVAQRNVEVGHPLALSRAPEGQRPPTSTGPGGTGARELRRLVAFNNPYDYAIRSTLEFDLRALPSGIAASFSARKGLEPRKVVGAKRDSSGVWHAAPRKCVVLEDVPIAAGDAVFVEVVLEVVGKLPRGRRYAVDLLQRTKKAVGGATIVVQTAGHLPALSPKLAGDEREVAGLVDKRERPARKAVKPLKPGKPKPG